MRKGPVPRLRTCLLALAAAACAGTPTARGDGVPAAGPAPAPAPAPAASEGEREEPGPILYDSEVDGAGDPRILVVRVVDEVSTAPIAGAAVSVHREAQHPVPGAVAPLATGVTDGAGWARIDVAGKFPGDTPWVYVEAKGHAPGALYGTGSRREPIALRRAQDVAVEVRDAFERPVAGARVGLHLGCGHTPDVRDVVTDAAGRATLPSASAACAAELWVVADGLEATYHDLTAVPAGDGPRVVRCLPAPAVEGRVVDLEGKPVVGAAVGTRTYHRGPWTRTDADGRFRLLGCSLLPGAEGLRVETTDPPVARTDVPGVSFPRPPYGVPVLVRVGPTPKEAPKDDDEDEPRTPAGPTTRVHVALRAKAGKQVVEGARVAVSREDDGLTFADATDDQGEVTLDLPRGRYVIRTGVPAGDATLEWAGATAPLVVGDDGPQLVRVEVERNPTLDVDLASLPGDVTVQVVTPTRVLTVPTDPESPARKVPRPLDEPAALRLSARGLVRVLTLPAAGSPEGARTFEVAWFPVRHVTAHVAGPDGVPVEARAVLVAEEEAKFDDVAPAREVDLHAPAELGMRLVVEPADPHLRRRAIALPPLWDVPEVVLGEVRLDPAPAAPLLLLPDGSPAADVEVRIERVDPAAGGEARSFAGKTGSGGRVIDVDQDDQAAIEPGAVLHAFAPGRGLAPLRAGLEPGAADRALRWPAGSISWTVVDEAGAPVENALVSVDGAVRSPAEGETSLGGLPAGPHEVVVTAPGRRARVYTVLLADGEERKLAARLGKN